MTEPQYEGTATSSLAVKLFLFGFVLMFAGAIILLLSAVSGEDGAVSGGVIIFVGPIPIILGAGPYASLAIVLAAVLTVIGFIVFFWMRKRVRF